MDDPVQRKYFPRASNVPMSSATASSHQLSWQRTATQMVKMGKPQAVSMVNFVLLGRIMSNRYLGEIG